MCGTCGCSDDDNAVTLTDPETGEETLLRRGSLAAASHSHGVTHAHAHAHSIPHVHTDDPVSENPHVHAHETLQTNGPGGEVISLEIAVMDKNNRIAERNRGWFEGRGVLALNLVSSPGAGKTALLERTIHMLGSTLPICVIEGDQMTNNDAQRIRAAGARAIQINTGAGCHLEADMVARAVAKLDPQAGSILMIENVGNLVCPAMFDLGERMKIAIISTTEGEDKPLKYPHMFRASKVILINKMDLAQYVEFDEKACMANIQQINPAARIFTVSAKSGAGMDSWIEFLHQEVRHSTVDLSTF